MKFHENFISFKYESEFTKELLCSGVNQIRCANYARKGLYFQAFSNLSIGLERIGKLCLILNYIIENSGSFPNEELIKVKFGHNLKSIYDESQRIISKNPHNYSFKFLDNLDNEIFNNIYVVLSNFAKGDRYSNLNRILKSKKVYDPISEWVCTVDKLLIDHHISEKKWNKINTNASIIQDQLSSIAYVLYISENGKVIDSVYAASVLTGIQEAISPFRQLYLLQIIRYWVELIEELQYQAMEICPNDFPFFGEIFGIFYNPDSYFKSRKVWE